MTIQIAKDELRRNDINPDAWWGLTFRERRWIASIVLHQRNTPKDHFDAKMIEMQNPNFNDFVLVGQ